jgi:hypothetical protein
MTPEEFRRWGHAVVDWVADYQQRVESLPVLSTAQPGQIRASLPAEPPLRGEPFDAILADVEKLILPGITHWQSPNFFAFFPANNSGPSILGELLSAGLGLPDKFKSAGAGGGVIQDSASSGVLCALLAAREAPGLAPDASNPGAAGPALAIGEVEAGHDEDVALDYGLLAMGTPGCPRAFQARDVTDIHVAQAHAPGGLARLHQCFDGRRRQIGKLVLRVEA